jgi:hypothetical protein
MSTRNSGYARVPSDLYQTLAWVTASLGEHINLAGRRVWEPACGEGKMVRALSALGARVLATDLHDYGFQDMLEQLDFFAPEAAARYDFQDIISNPPYGPQGHTAERFIVRGLEQLPLGGVLALLLQADFDSAGGRRHLFRDCEHFAGRIVLNRRIEWFPREIKPDGKKAGGPSGNHCWYIWEKRVIRAPRAPFVLYAPTAEVRHA